MSIKIEIKKRNKDYGLLSWSKEQDFEVMTLFNKSDYLTFVVDNGKPKRKKISYKYRRISIGKKTMENNSKSKLFVLSKSNGNIKVSFE